MPSAHNIPFAWILPAAASGIVLANVFAFPWWALAAACAVCYAMAWAGREHPSGEVCLLAAVLCTFMVSGKASIPRSALPHGERITMVARMDGHVSVKGRWASSTATVTSYRDGGGWHDLRERVILSADTSFNLISGDRMALRGYVNPLGEGSYASLMSRRGVYGRVYLTPGNLVRVSAEKYDSPGLWASGLQTKARERLSRMGLGDDGFAVASAMTLGYRGDMSGELRDEYSRSGTAHLLAVSGLHVGMVFLLVNLLLWLLPAVRGGHVAKNVSAVAVMWLYAMVTGLSPSVVRATIMFSGAQTALATTSFRQPVNILLGTAFVMLALGPNNLYDISFQMSFLAVLFIMLWFGPLYRMFRTRYRLLNALISLVLVSVVATLATAPLTARVFGYYSLVGILVNPLVVVTAHVVVLSGLVWIIVPVEALAPLFRLVTGTAVDVQNMLASWGASRSWGSGEVTMPLWGVPAVYALYLAVTYIIYRRPRKRNDIFEGVT